MWIEVGYAKDSVRKKSKSLDEVKMKSKDIIIDVMIGILA